MGSAGSARSQVQAARSTRGGLAGLRRSAGGRQFLAATRRVR